MRITMIYEAGPCNGEVSFDPTSHVDFMSDEQIIAVQHYELIYGDNKVQIPISGSDVFGKTHVGRYELSRFVDSPEQNEQQVFLQFTPQPISESPQIEPDYSIPMNSSHLTREQIDAIEKKIADSLLYLTNLQQRMDTQGFPADDPIYRETRNAQTAMQRLRMSLHYLGSSGVGQSK